MKKTVAVVILTYNEEKNIAACLESAAFADERIVIDSGSSDATREIAAGLGANVFVHAMADQGFAGQRNYALECSAADWFLYLDADERLTPELSDEIIELVNQEEIAAYEILRRNIVFGKKILHGGHAPDFCCRLFPRTAVKWRGLVHEEAVVEIPIKRMQHFMWHHTYTSWQRYFLKFDQYTTLMAKKMHEKGKRSRLSDIILRPVGGFIKFYILKQGWRDGRMGFVLASLHFLYVMLKYQKLYELQNGDLAE